MDKFKEYLLYYISRIQLKNMYTVLPSEYQNDSDVKMALPCEEHWSTTTTATDQDTIDGPPPRKRNCIECRRRLCF